MYSLRPDQLRAVERCEEFLLTSKRGQGNPSLLLRAPTGSGKSYVEAELLRRLRSSTRHVQIVPSIEIAAGIARKLGVITSGKSEQQVRTETEQQGIYTSLRFRNLLLRSEVPLPHTMAFDEAHHAEARTWQELWDLCGQPPRVGLTATTYRGTPESTNDLLNNWGNNIYEMISLKDAIAQGIIAQPTFSVWPLLNDDLIRITNGEFSVSSSDSLAQTKMDDLVDQVAAFYNGTEWDRVTMIALPGVDSVKYAEACFKARGLPVIAVTGETAGREEIFADVVARKALLLQVRVVGEGVDLPIRRVIDCSPTMSPQLWMQRVGRGTRPTGADEPPPEYIACNHNLTRHAYLWYGIIPPIEMKKAQIAWGDEYKPNRRSMARAIGIEGFGRFSPTPVPLLDGLTGSFYALTNKEGTEEFAVFLHPVVPQPLFFRRDNQWLEGDHHLIKTFPDGTEIRGRKRERGRWRRVEALPDREGLVSLPAGNLSPAQKWTWENKASAWGLDGKAKINSKTYAAYFALSQSGIKIKGVQ